MDFLSVIKLLGGIGLFMFGMSLTSSSLEKIAGSDLERLLERQTTSKKKRAGLLKGWGMGAGITAIIQSSTATSIMLMGFVNAGIMKIAQAIPVIFGANVGSTITAQILRLGDLGGESFAARLLRPSGIASVLVVIGAFITLFSKKKSMKNVAGVMVGMGLLFYGMFTMEEIFEPFRDSEKFRSALGIFSNPFLGIALGFAVTAILQSSNASVGILQALTVTGSVTFGIAVPVIIGQNLGKGVTTLFGSLGASREAKRITVAYFLFNIFGALFFGLIIYGVYYTAGIPGFSYLANHGDIATLHLGFNLITSMLLLPMTDKIASLTEKFVRKEAVSPSDLELSKLDDMLLNTPSIALDQCRHVIEKMGEAIRENYIAATSLIYEYDPEKLPMLEKNENFIDRCETQLSSYIVRINRNRLTRDDKLVVSEILNSISDFERIGDYCMNIAFVAQEKNEKNIHFSPAGHRETVTIVSAVSYALETMFEAFRKNDDSIAVRMEPLSEAIDELKETIKSHHVERLQTGDCSIEGGVALFDLLASFERITSHSANIALHVIKRVVGDKDFDEMHGHVGDSFSEEYKALYHYYVSRYVEPLQRPVTEEEIREFSTTPSEIIQVEVDKEKEAAGEKSIAASEKSKKDKAARGKDKSEKK